MYMRYEIVNQRLRTIGCCTPGTLFVEEYQLILMEFQQVGD